MASPISALKRVLRSLISRGSDQRFENGVYIWSNGEFERIHSYRSLLASPGRYLIYFHNNLCPHCRRFHPLFRSLLESLGRAVEGLTVIRVVCDWFASRCSDEDAASMFREFGVHESPKILLVRVGSDGSRGEVDLSQDVSVLRDPEKLRTALIALLSEERRVGGA